MGLEKHLTIASKLPMSFGLLFSFSLSCCRNLDIIICLKVVHVFFMPVRVCVCKKASISNKDKHLF